MNEDSFAHLPFRTMLYLLLLEIVAGIAAIYGIVSGLKGEPLTTWGCIFVILLWIAADRIARIKPKSK